MKTIFTHHTITIEHCPKADYIHLLWQGTVELEVYKEALTACADYAIGHKVSRFLVDQSALEYVGSAAQAWLSVVWFPRMERSLDTNAYFAIVASPKLFVNVASKVVAKKISQKNTKHVIWYFEDDAQAKEWLLGEDSMTEWETT
ncbi:hypothetical protein [Eisenibacter elegans]|jgi:hypothetical protein|uniref:hypothetical protein n=1 Tax=Eisenibacter elegans TaxID=997 RepID=UPI000417FDA6|nr:hypothetical protein [Eisenibacter elegans]